MPKEFPANTAAFIRKHIPSVERLEILLLLQGAPDRRWTVGQVYEQIRSTMPSCAGHMKELAAQGFLEPAGYPELTEYQYRPRSRELAQDVDGLAALYRERRVTVIEHIFAEPPSPIQGFADSFRIRKKDENG